MVPWDHDSQYAGDEWIRFCNEQNLVRNMSRRGKTCDTASTGDVPSPAMVRPQAQYAR
jgi:predicted RNA-binding protein with PUA domain